MPIDWTQGGFDTKNLGTDILSGIGDVRRELYTQNQDANRPQYDKMMAAGDYAGAQKSALATGNTEAAKNAMTMSTNENTAKLSAAKALNDSMHRGIGSLLAIRDPNLRAQHYNNVIKPSLLAQGAPADILDKIDLSDDTLLGYASETLDVEKQINNVYKSNEYNYITGPNGENLRFSKYGGVVSGETPENFVQPGTPATPEATSGAPVELSTGNTAPGTASAPLVNIQPRSAPAAGTSAVTREQFGNAIAAQESGNNYAARNSGSGAMGKYQVMPETARTIASRLGLAWRPELMTSNTLEGRQYQDAIGKVALDEAWKAGGNGANVDNAAMYYHGGSNRNIWGPKTRQYASDIRGRLGTGGGVAVNQLEQIATGQAPAPVVPMQLAGAGQFGQVTQGRAPGSVTPVYDASGRQVGVQVTDSTGKIDVKMLPAQKSGGSGGGDGSGSDVPTLTDENGLKYQNDPKTGLRKYLPDSAQTGGNAKIRQATQRANQALPAILKTLNEIGADYYKTTTTDAALAMAGRDLSDPMWSRLASPAAQRMIGSKRAFAAMIKPLVRDAGDGVFTNDDQKYMLSLIPDPGDARDVAESKIKTLTDFIYSKVQQPQASNTTSQQRFDAAAYLRQQRGQ